MECNDTDEVIRLAVEAVKLTPLCADAFNLLADSICYNNAERVTLTRWATRAANSAAVSESLKIQGICTVLWTPDLICARARNLHGRCGNSAATKRRYPITKTLSFERQDHIALALLMTGYLELRRFDDAKRLFDRTANRVELIELRGSRMVLADATEREIIRDCTQTRT